MIKKMGSNGHITIPKEYITKLGLSQNTLVDVHIEGDRLIIEQQISIPKSQEYFFTKDWQKEEFEAQKDIQNGQITKTDNLEALFDILDGKKNGFPE